MKSKFLKTEKNRLSEVIEIRKKMKQSGLEDNMNGVKDFILILNDFFKTGKEFKGNIYLSDFDKYIQYILTNNLLEDNLVAIKKNI